MLTNSVDERYTVEVTARKWKRDSRGDWKWCGYLKDVHANDQGIYVYKVQEGTWIELYMVNRGVQVDISCVCEQMDQYLQRMRHYYRVILFPREEHSMNAFRVEGGVIDVRSEDPPHRTVLHMQFERVGTVDGSEQNRQGPAYVGGLLA